MPFFTTDNTYYGILLSLYVLYKKFIIGEVVGGWVVSSYYQNKTELIITKKSSTFSVPESAFPLPLPFVEMAELILPVES